MSGQAADFFDLGNFWDALLSRQPDHVRAAYYSLDSQRKAEVYNHLQRMVSEPGWHPEQRISAQAALDVLKDES